MLSEEVHNQSVHSTGIGWEARNGNSVGAADLLPQIVPRQLSLSLLPLLLHTPILLSRLL